MAAAAPHYVRWGVLFITVPNLVVLCLMFVVFAAAVALRLPAHGETHPHPHATPPKEDGTDA